MHVVAYYFYTHFDIAPTDTLMSDIKKYVSGKHTTVSSLSDLYIIIVFIAYIDEIKSCLLVYVKCAEKIYA